MAGKGTRLRPHTFNIPKPLVEFAGAPMVAHVIDSVKKVKFEEIILIVDKDYPELRTYLEKKYKVKITFIKQLEQKGVGHAIYGAHSKLKKEEVLIIFADTLVEADFSVLKEKNTEAVIWTKKVEDPRKFGVVYLENDYITRLIEKPEVPDTDLAIVGLYYFKDSDVLFDSLKYIIDNNIKSKGEFMITDSFQYLINNGLKIKTGKINEWKDCGNYEALIEANKYLLKKIDVKTKPKSSVIIKPVHIGPGAQIKNSIIGPNVSIGKDAVVSDSRITDSIIGKDAVVLNALLDKSIIGKNAKVNGKSQNLNIGEYCIIN